MKLAPLVCSVFLAATTAASALTIEIDYFYDATSGTNFFAANTTARLALEAAAADLSAAIGPSLGAVNTDVFMGSNLGTTVTANWSLSTFNPINGSTVALENFTFAADTVRIFAGLSNISGLILGQGGSGGASLSLGSTGPGANIPGALDNAEAASNAVMTRGSGPIVGSLSGTFAGSAYAFDFGTLIGSLALDADTNDDGFTDSMAMLEAFWHFDHTTPVAAAKFDFYSVALHEMTHALGFGASDMWDAQVSGTNWLGVNVIALTGSGAGLVTDDGHITAGLASFRLSDGAMQEVAMDPTLLPGTRKSLTELDLAFLRDLGYATVPEPSAAALLALALVLTSQRRSRPPAPCGGKSCRRL